MDSDGFFLGAPVKELRLLNADSTGGASAGCTCIFPGMNASGHDGTRIGLASSERRDGVARYCSCKTRIRKTLRNPASSAKALLVAKADAVFAYDPQEGNMYLGC